jgi:uncharacterized membrane protein
LPGTSRRTWPPSRTPIPEVVVLYAVSFALRRDNLDEADVTVPAFVVSVVAYALLGVSGWLGGKLAYHYGVRVADEGTQASGFVRHHD